MKVKFSDCLSAQLWVKTTHNIQPTFKLYIAYGDFVKSVKMRAMVISLVSICMALALFHEARMHSELGSMNVATKLLGIHSKALKHFVLDEKL